MFREIIMNKECRKLVKMLENFGFICVNGKRINKHFKMRKGNCIITLSSHIKSSNKMYRKCISRYNNS